MIQSVHTTNLLRKDFSWIPGKQILNLELLVGGLWCIFLNQLNQSHSASYSFPVCGSLFFLNHQLFREAERGKWDGSKKPFFCPLIAQLCLMLQLPLPWHMEQLRAGMDILRWGWAQPDLALGIYQQLSICHLLAQNTFFSFKTQNRCPVLGDYEVSFHASSSWSVWHTRHGPYRGESFANRGEFGGWNRKSTVASWKIKAKTHR